MAIIVSCLILEFTVSKEVIVTGSVRVDLLGGTLDLVPINLILPNVVTLNLATSLKAKVKITEIDFDGVEIVSKDYNKTDRFNSSDFNPVDFDRGVFGNLTFIAEILYLFSLNKGVRLELESGSPPGAGLGGSSAMGVTCYSAISEFLGKPVDRVKAIQQVNALEARIIDCPAGYQDYYPALFGGVLGLRPSPGSVEVHQLYTEELKRTLEENITLVYSGETRNSGINNWEVYKAFFNKDAEVRRGLGEIARLSWEAYKAISGNNYSDLIELIAAEGEERRKLFPGILTSNMSQLHMLLKSQGAHMGMKICGAGGGGCFLITHHKNDVEYINQLLAKFQMKKLPFNVEKPL
jgi:D-glycero-alpha-D-manno-heptose-7-phosphate kinase